MDAVTSQYAPGELRVSDADRDRALAELSEHYQAGRLTLEEFDERSGRALEARTARELTDLFTDLPPATDRTAEAVAVYQAGRHLPAARVVAAAVALSALAVVVVLARSGVGHRHGFVFPVPVFFVLFFLMRRLCWPRRGGAVPDAQVQDK